MTEVSDYPSGTHAQIMGLSAKPELNDQYCVSLGVSENPERLKVVTKTGSQLSLRPANLKPAELLSGGRVVVVGLVGAAKYNGSFGEVFSWQGDRWIVDLDSKERKSFKSANLVIVPAAIGGKKRAAEDAEQPEAKKAKTSDLKDLESSNEQVVGRAVVRLLREFPIFAQVRPFLS
eukprot:TRINITY_DN11674_c0_g1_i4.p2 TRINITY_DN11674_c0_g1~~TRINITY_DN11674_c0_g1_i4.p2  ORF type:complete len:176 (+),score=49.62 TRINITY_DN11674_c0_g1_i4:141-668(+)